MDSQATMKSVKITSLKILFVCSTLKILSYSFAIKYKIFHAPDPPE